MYLQLAENSYALSDGPFPLAAGPDMRNYLFIPDGNIQGGGTWQNVSYFKDMPPAQYEEVLDALLPYQPNIDLKEDGMGLFGIGKKAQAWKEEKRNVKIAKQQAKTTKVLSKADLIKAKAAGIEGGTYDPQSGLKGIIGGVTDTVKGIFGRGADPKLDISGGVDFGNTPEPTFLKKWGPWILGLGGLAVVGYFFLRKK